MSIEWELLWNCSEIALELLWNCSEWAPNLKKIEESWRSLALGDLGQFFLFDHLKKKKKEYFGSISGDLVFFFSGKLNTTLRFHRWMHRTTAMAWISLAEKQQKNHSMVNKIINIDEEMKYRSLNSEENHLFPFYRGFAARGCCGGR